MFKSGVGPRKFIENLRVPLIREMPEMGKGLHDRVLIPIGLFFGGEMPKSGFPPTVCQSIGLAKVGPDCQNFNIGDSTLSCSLATGEELSGARIAEGVVYATRFIVPPQIRYHPVVVTLLQVIGGQEMQA